MIKATLEKLCAEMLFRIPDYQRGYAWEGSQWKDFVEDLDALTDPKVLNHYTGTLVTFQRKGEPLISYGVTKRYVTVEVVDGQQRLTTCSLYLAVLLKKFRERGITDFDAEATTYLYSGALPRLTTNYDTSSLFLDLLSKGTPNTPASTTHQKRLVAAYSFLAKHIDHETKARKDDADQYLRDLFDAVTRKMNFTHYPIEEESEIGMTFELMNSRGKELSSLELLKNYFMHWIYRNTGTDEALRDDMTAQVNKDWKDVYNNIGLSDGDEDQCLRVAWTLLRDYQPKNWQGYRGFKEPFHVPLRVDGDTKRTEVGTTLRSFSSSLATVSGHYAAIRNPSSRNTHPEEASLLAKLNNANTLANFYAIIVGGRMQVQAVPALMPSYLNLLRALECFAYRCYLTEGRRSDAGKSALFRWAYDLHNGIVPIEQVPDRVNSLSLQFFPTEKFHAALEQPENWYRNVRRLRYTLYEYELHLLHEEGKKQKPRLKWSDLGDSTIEHILPQNPDPKSKWVREWAPKHRISLTHDLGNLVLTVNNSNYSNSEFSVKKGQPGKGFSYANSDIRQERKIASFSSWLPADVRARRQDLVAWIEQRWFTPAPIEAVAVESDDEDEDVS